MTLDVSCLVQCMKIIAFLQVTFGKFEEGSSIGSDDK